MLEDLCACTIMETTRADSWELALLPSIIWTCLWCQPAKPAAPPLLTEGCLDVARGGDCGRRLAKRGPCLPTRTEANAQAKPLTNTTSRIQERKGQAQAIGLRLHLAAIGSLQQVILPRATWRCLAVATPTQASATGAALEELGLSLNDLSAFVDADRACYTSSRSATPPSSPPSLRGSPGPRRQFLGWRAAPRGLSEGALSSPSCSQTDFAGR